MADYIKWIRSKVGKEPIFLNVANAIVLNDRREILLQRRGDHSEATWGTPGGAMEIGESAQQTLRREISEETGLQIDIDYFLGAYTGTGVVTYPNGDACQVIMFSFVCHPTGGELKIDQNESKELRYFDLHNRPELFRKHMEAAISDFLTGTRGVIR